MGLYDWNNITPEEISGLYKRKVALGENITVAMVEVKQWAVTQPHSHDSEEVIIVLKGAWKFHLPDGDVVLKANQMLQIPPGVEHSSEVIEDTIAFDICSPRRHDWIAGDDRALHHDPDDFLWAV
jgi:quercetin dioxygenase-like cupin family protein